VVALAQAALGAVQGAFAKEDGILGLYRTLAQRVRETGDTILPSSEERAAQPHPREVNAAAVAREVRQMTPEWRQAYLDSKRPPMPAPGSLEWSRMMEARAAAGELEDLSRLSPRDRYLLQFGRPAGSQNPDG
jgi:hypothetical protein